MMINDEFKPKPKMKSPSTQRMSFENCVAIYSAFTILSQMKNRLGLEAMLDYMDRYQSLISANNPEVKVAVERAVALMNVEKMYGDAVNGGPK